MAKTSQSSGKVASGKVASGKGSTGKPAKVAKAAKPPAAPVAPASPVAADTGPKHFAASHRGARISPFKVRPVIDLVRGKRVEEALKLLEFEPRRAAPLIVKVLRSALANASSDLKVNLKRLVVSEACVDGGPLLSGRRRWRPRAMGRAFPIMKRTSHIRVTLAEGSPQGAGGEG